VSAGVFVVSALTLLAALAHPSHTSTAELVARGDSIHVAIRLFADDLIGAGDLRAYVRRHFGMTDAAGTPVPLGWAGARRAGDEVFVRLAGRSSSGLSGAVVRHELLMERFADQVNLVRATYGGRTRTLVYLRGEGPKALP
jgi:hypothetical protein